MLTLHQAVGSRSVLLPSIVVRHYENRAAFRFITSIRHGRLIPEPEFADLFRVLESAAGLLVKTA